jgi:hypothetical protein
MRDLVFMIGFYGRDFQTQIRLIICGPILQKLSILVENNRETQGVKSHLALPRSMVEQDLEREMIRSTKRSSRVHSGCGG